MRYDISWFIYTLHLPKKTEARKIQRLLLKELWIVSMVLIIKLFRYIVCVSFLLFLLIKHLYANISFSKRKKFKHVQRIKIAALPTRSNHQETRKENERDSIRLIKSPALRFFSLPANRKGKPGLPLKPPNPKTNKVNNLEREKKKESTASS